MQTRLTYTGSYEGAYQLVADLRAADLEVSWAPPDHQRGGMIQEIIVGIVAGGAVDVLHTAIESYLERNKKTEITIDVEEEKASSEQPPV